MTYKALLCAASTLIAATAAPALATTVEFGTPNWVYNSPDEVAWRVSINDDTANVLTVGVSIDPGSSVTGDILGFGFDTTITGLTVTDFTLTEPSSVTLGSFGTNSTSCGTGCNFNGATTDAFDYIFSVGGTGSSSGKLTAFEFTIDVAPGFMLTEDTFTRVGIRAQSVGPVPDGGNGSVKDLNLMAEEVMSPVPLPAAAWLMLAALGGLGALRLRKTA